MLIAVETMSKSKAFSPVENISENNSAAKGKPHFGFSRSEGRIVEKT
jgi:hypothetical protein